MVGLATLNPPYIFERLLENAKRKDNLFVDLGNPSLPSP